MVCLFDLVIQFEVSGYIHEESLWRNPGLALSSCHLSSLGDHVGIEDIAPYNTKSLERFFISNLLPFDRTHSASRLRRESSLTRTISP